MRYRWNWNATYPAASISTLIGSVRDFDRMETVFKKYRPNIVYHAAAHKHVPLWRSLQMRP